MGTRAVPNAEGKQKKKNLEGLWKYVGNDGGGG